MQVTGTSECSDDRVHAEVCSLTERRRFQTCRKERVRGVGSNWDYSAWAGPFDPMDKRPVGIITAQSSCVSSLPQRIAWATIDWAETAEQHGAS